MSYPIETKLIHYNRPGTYLSPEGVVIHSTGDPGATALNEFTYFDTGVRSASAHFFVDWNGIIQTIPEQEMAWHSGPSSNRRFLSIELCEAKNEEDFKKVWNAGVWLTAYLCRKYVWEVGPGVFSHRYISGYYRETDHDDPYPYFNRFGRTWIDFTQAVKAELEGGETMRNLVLYHAGDIGAAMILKDALRCATLDIEYVTPDDIQSAEKVYQLGGAKVDPKVELIAGPDRFATAQLVLDKIKEGGL